MDVTNREYMTKSVLIGLFLIALLITRIDSPASEVAGDWRLKAFDEANATWIENRKAIANFLVEREPRLKEYFDKVSIPFDESCVAVRRYLFAMKLQRNPAAIDCDKNIHVWAIGMPFDNELEVIAHEDPGFVSIYGAYKVRADAYKSCRKGHGEWLDYYREAYKKYARELYQIESKEAEEFERIGKSVAERRNS